jgi:hypothetical protein
MKNLIRINGTESVGQLANMLNVNPDRFFYLGTQLRMRCYEDPEAGSFLVEAGDWISSANANGMCTNYGSHIEASDVY